MSVLMVGFCIFARKARLISIAGGYSFIIDLCGDNSDPFIQALVLFAKFGGVLCVQMTKPFLAERTPSGQTANESSRTNGTKEELISNSTETMTTFEIASSFESDIECAYFILGASCIVGTILQILSWFHSGCKLSPFFAVESNTQPHSLPSSQSYEHKRQVLIVVSSILCSVSFLGFAVDETFGSFGMSFTVNTLGWATNDASNLLTLYWGSTLACNCISVIFAKFVPVYILWTVSILIGLTGTILMASMIETVQISLWVGACVLGFGIGNVVPNTMNTGKTLPVQASIMSSVLLSSGFAGSIVAPQVIGYLLDHEDPIWFLYICIVYTGSALVLSLLFKLVLVCSSRYENVGQGEENDFQLQNVEIH